MAAKNRASRLFWIEAKTGKWSSGIILTPAIQKSQEHMFFGLVERWQLLHSCLLVAQHLLRSHRPYSKPGEVTGVISAYGWDSACLHLGG